MAPGESFFRRLSASGSDLVTATLFLAAWVAPLAIGVGQVRALPPAIVVEFFVMHASGLYGLGLRRRATYQVGSRTILGVITVAYLVPVVLASVQLQSPWPAISFAWLYAGRFAMVWLHPATAEEETRRMQALWLVSVLSFFAGAIVVSKLPLPVLGMKPDALVAISLSHHPRPDAQVEGVKTMAFGVFYFLVQACAKFWLAGRGNAPQRPATSTGTA